MDTTYAQLHEAHKTRLIEEKGELPIQVMRNHLSVLNSYLVLCGKTLENKVGREFTHDFIKKSAEFVDLVCGGNKKSGADKMSILRSWHKTVATFTRSIRLNPPSGVSHFHQELRVAVTKTGETIAAIARAVKCNPGVLGKWLRGAYPFKTGVPAFRRLEAYLGFERGYLESLLSFPRANVVSCQNNDKYVERLRKNMKSRYLIPYEALKPELKAEWQKLIQYKTAAFPFGLKRSSRGSWRAISVQAADRQTIKNPMCQAGNGMVCPSAARTAVSLRSFLGFLIKPTTDEEYPGLGLPRNAVQTLAMLVVPEFVNAYLEFVRARSGNITHGGHVAFGGLVGNLTRETEGYLAQQPAFYKKIEAFANGRTWDPARKPFRLRY